MASREEILGKVVEVHWLDASDKTEVSLSEVEKKKPAEFLVSRVSVGYVGNENEDGIVLITDIDETDDCEITTIPKQWCMEIKVLYDKNININAKPTSGGEKRWLESGKRVNQKKKK